MKRILSTLLAVLICLTSIAPIGVFAATDAVFTFESVSGYAGDSIQVTVSLASTQAVDSIAVGTISYDSDVLTFTGFSDNEHLAEKLTFGTLDMLFVPSKMSFTVPLKTAEAYNGKLCVLNFTINPDTTVSSTKISAGSVVTKKGSTTYTSSLIDSTVTVSKRKFEGVTFPSAELTYDGKEHEVAVKGLPSNIEGSNVVYKNNKATEAGSYNAEAVITAPGYEELKLTSTLKINPVKLTVSNLKADNKVYDGTDKATINSSAAALTGVVAGDNVSVNWPSKGTFKEGKGVGNNKAVEIEELVLEGSAAKNYTLTLPVLFASITKAPLSINVEDVQLKIDAKLPSKYNYTQAGLAKGDDVVIEVAANGASTAVAGKTFPITATVKGSDIGNYDISIKNGTLTIIDKDAQKFKISDIPAKTYGDEAFNLNYTDNNSDLGKLNFASSNEKVATVDASGKVTVKGAGSAIITVSRSGNNDIADLKVEKALVVNKKKITVTATSFTLKQNNTVPELKYTTNVDLVEGDSFTGKLSVNTDGTVIGTYAIKQGTLKLSDNYEVTFVEGKLTVIDKTPQNIKIPEKIEAVYGDSKINLAADIVDNSAALGNLAYATNDNTVAAVDEDGKITINNAGSAVITVSRKGNADFADLSKEVAVTVKPAKVTGFKDYADGIKADTETAAKAYEKGIKSTADIKATLPEKVNVVYGAYQDVIEADIEWADAPQAYNVKGGTYTFVGTPKANSNLDFNGLTLTAKMEITPIEVALEEALKDVTVAENTVKKAEDFKDIERIPLKVVLGGKEIAAKWNKTINDLKAVQVNGSLEVSLDLEAMGFPYLTVTSPITFTFKVTDKYPVNVKVTQKGSVYGTALAAPVATQEALDDGTDEGEVSYTYLYKGVDTTVYESAEAPKAAGKYTVTAALVSSTHAGSGTSEVFEIKPFDVTYNVANKSKKYKEANPVFEGALAEGTTLPYEETVDGLGITFSCSEEVVPAGTTLDITAAASNTNYNVTVVNGKLTIVKKPLSDEDILAPAISGSGKIGLSVIAGKLSGIEDSEYEYEWFLGEDKIADKGSSEYIPQIIDSGKALTVKAKAKDVNYEGVSKASEAVTVETYEIKGNLAYTNGENTSIAKGNTIDVDLTGIENYATLNANGAEFTYQWKLDGKAIEGATAKSYTIDAEKGVLSVDVTAKAPFGGTISLTIGEIGKATLPGSITITETEGEITLNNNIGTAVEGVDYKLKWFRDGVEFEVVGGTYTVTDEDAGKTITVKAIAMGDNYTGELLSTTITVPAKVPSNVAINTSVTSDSITATFTAKSNGADIQKFVATITDGTTPKTVEVANVNGVFQYTFTGLTAGTTYTITAKAHNSVGVDNESASVTATPKTATSSSGGGGIAYYTIKFNTNGGSAVSNIRVRRNNVATKPANPTKEGYIFAGWYADKALTKAFDFSNKITASVTVYAKWEEGDITKKQIILTIGDKNAKVFGESKANDVAPKIVNSRTMLPIRFVAEALGATVTWTESAPDKVLITKGDIKIEITIDSDKAYVNNKLVTLDSPAFLENDRTYMPLRFITENLGEQVEWNEKTQQVTITIK